MVEATGSNVFFQAILRLVPVFEVHVYGYAGYGWCVFLPCVHVWEIMWDMRLGLYFRLCACLYGRLCGIWLVCILARVHLWGKECSVRFNLVCVHREKGQCMSSFCGQLAVCSWEEGGRGVRMSTCI